MTAVGREDTAVDLGLRERVVIVTGGASNIGRTIALAFAAAGARVAIADIDIEQAERVTDTMRERGAASALAVQTDITQVADVQRAAARVAAEFGRIDILVNNAGWTRRSKFLDLTPEQCLRIIAINLAGTMNVTRAVLPTMVAQGNGSIVSVGSDAGRIGERGEGVYGAAKAGVISLTKTLAREHGRHGIRLNVVCPGAVVPSEDDEVGSTSLWRQDEYAVYQGADAQAAIQRAYPLGRLGQTRDVADAVLFLASERASFITGQTLSVSGGYTMC
ncbi:MAG: short-chain dehydrogenase/reductase [Solirubrobacterales bacterium]|nr:short-chain dehydrogenase/reductase [Solirubrobacterales bacterium]